MRFLITGGPRSGTNYLSNMLNTYKQDVVRGESMFFNQQMIYPSLYDAIENWVGFAGARKHTWSTKHTVEGVMDTLLSSLMPPGICGEHSVICDIEEYEVAKKLFDRIIYIRRNPVKCVESFYKLWAKQVRDNTGSSLLLTTIFDDRDYPVVRPHRKQMLINSIEQTQKYILDDPVDNVVFIDYSDLIQWPGIAIKQTVAWLFREVLHPDKVDYIVGTNSKDKFMEERPEHFV